MKDLTPGQLLDMCVCVCVHWFDLYDEPLLSAAFLSVRS